MRNIYSNIFEFEMQQVAGKHTLDELLNIARSKYKYNITKSQLRQYLSGRQIRYKDYNANKARNMGRYIPIGTEYVKDDGMTLIKTAENKWQYKQRYIYEQYHHVKLTSDDYIIFLDQNKNNFDINNLKKITRRESSILANQHLFSNQSDVTEKGIKTAKSIIKSKEMGENMNIYEKQMKELKLNPKEYAELTGVPYELVKDVIYDKEGNYSMEIKDFLRKNMFNKHQEIENNFTETKFKAMEIKNKEVDYLDWYDKEYSSKLLKEKLKLSSVVPAFKEKYMIKIDDKEPSRWYYNSILNKREYDGKKLDKEKKRQFVEQLYDILVNKNESKYLKTREEISEKILKWYKNFDFENFKSKYNLTNNDIADKLNLAYSTACQIISKKYNNNQGIQKMYEFVNEFENSQEITTASTLEEPVVVEMNSQIEEPVNIISQRTLEQDIIKKLLINRLTEEEKMLIELFGGKIE